MNPLAVVAALLLMFAPTTATDLSRFATARQHNACGDTARAVNALERFRPLFFADDVPYPEFRADMGIKRLKASARVEAVTDEVLCAKLLPEAYSALRASYAEGIRPEDYLYTYMRFGSYYAISVRLDPAKDPVAARQSHYAPTLVFDLKTLKYLGSVLG